MARGLSVCLLWVASRWWVYHIPFDIELSGSVLIWRMGATTTMKSSDGSHD